MTCGDGIGEVKGYMRHRRAGEQPCEACRVGYNEYKRARLRRINRESRVSTRSVVVDVLITEGRWLSSDLLIDMVLSLHPEWNERRVRRCIDRMVGDAIIDRRVRRFSYRDGLSGQTPSGYVRGDRIAEFRADDSAWEKVA